MRRHRRSLVGSTVVAVWSVLLVPLALAAVLTTSDLSDTVPLTDRVTATLTAVFRPALDDAVGLADQVAASLRAVVRPSLNDNATVGDQVAVALARVFRPALDEAVTIGDEVTATLKATLRSSLDDSVSVSDQVAATRRASLRSALVEPIGVGDQVGVSLHAAIRPALGEQFSITEQIAIVHLSATNAQLADLGDAVTRSALPQGTMTSLMASVQAAQASNVRGQTIATCGQLEAFINKVQAQSGKTIPPALASELIRAAQRLQATVPCK